MESLTNLRESILHEADDKREALAGALLKQFEDLGVKVDPTSRNSITVELGKLLSLIDRASLSMVYKGTLAPILLVLSKFDTYPVKLVNLTPAMNKSTDFGHKSQEFPQDVYANLVKYHFFKWEYIKTPNDALVFYNNNVKDLIHYLLVMGLGEGVLGA